MSEERIDIVVSQKGATEVKRDLESLGQGARESSPAVQALKAAIDAVSSVTDKLKASLGGASAPVRELKKVMDDLTRSMAAVASTNFVTNITGTAQSLGPLTAEAVRAAGGIKALGDNFIMLGSRTGTALVPVSGLSSALVALTASMASTQAGSAATSVAVLSASMALSTMTISIAELSRRIVALGVLLAMLRDQFGSLKIGQGTQMLTDFGARARDITPALQPANQALLTFQGTASTTGSTLGGVFAGAFQRLQGIWGTFTQGVRNAWTAVTGLGGGAGGAVPPINNLGNALNGVGGAAGGVAGPVNTATSSFFSLWRILLALTIIRQITSAVFDAIDSWTLMGNKLRLVATDSQNLVASQEAIYQAAQRTRSGMEETATLYARTSQATKALGLSQREVLDVTELVALATKISGATTQEAAGSMLQLSQAFNKGKLNADEFRSIMTNNPRLLRAFAEGLGVTTGKIIEMSKAGELTLPKLIEAIQKSGPALRAEFGKALPTIAEGFTYVGNAVTRFIGKLNEATGFSLGFYNVMKFLGDNLGAIGVALAFVGTAVLMAFGPAAISAVVSFGAALGLATGGLSLIIPLLAAVVAAIYTWGDAWKVIADGVTVLDYIRAALQITGEYIGVVAGYIKTWFGSAWDYIKDKWADSGTFFNTLMQTIGQIVYTYVTTMLGLWIGVPSAIVTAFETLPAAIKAIFQLAMNGAVQVVQDALAGIISAINSVITSVGITAIKPPDLSGWKTEVDATALDAGAKIVGAFNNGMAQGKAIVDGAIGGLQGAADKLTDRARQISEERRKLEANQPKLSGTRGANTYKAPVEDDGSVDKLQNKLNALLRTIDPITGAQEKLRQGTETLNKAFEAGLITMERRDDLLKRLKEHLRDQLDPLGKINRDMAQEASLLRLGNDEREIQKKLLEDIEKLRKAGVNLSPLEQQKLEANIRSLATLKEQSKLLGDVLNRVFKGAEDAFIQFIETGKVNFSSLIKSMISDIARLAFQSFVTKSLTNMFQNVLGGLLGGIGGGGGGGFNIFGGLFGGGGAATPTLGGLFATGGDFTVGGQGGVDSQLVQFRASPGERVSVSRNGDSSGGGSGQQIVFNIQTPNVESFRQSEAQIAARMARIASRGNRNL